MYDELIKGYYWWCVQMLVDISKWMGITYEELNVWVFVIIHPLITIILILWVFRLKKLLKNT
ncbi:MAG: hypothetical protein VX923_00495 [Pseudomonadota bacterium]|nr:hypothetical protein [Pseudomonadota bacterium]